MNSPGHRVPGPVGVHRVDLNLLPMLAALLEHRSVTRAARAVGLTQPAMSNALARLRRTLSDELLVRVGREYVLTARGSALIGPVGLILETATHQVLTPPSFDPTTSQRTFHVAAASAASLTVLPALSTMVSRRAPGVRIHVQPLEVSTGPILADSTADVTLLPDNVPTSLPRERLYSEDWVIVADAANPEIGATLSAADMARLPHVVFESRGGRVGAQRTLDSLVPELAVQVVVPEFLMIPTVVSGTSMIALLQRRLAERMAPQAGLRVLESPIPLPALGIDLVWSPRSLGDPGRSWLRTQLLGAVTSSR